MFYFFLKILFILTILLTIYYLFNKKEIGILEELILLFTLNILLFGLYHDWNLFKLFLASSLIIFIYYFYKFLEENKVKRKLEKETKVFINRGIINFHELIKSHYSYNDLLYSLKKRGISNQNMVDYCIKVGNDIVVFGKNNFLNYPISLIVDGKILRDNLLSINKSNEWLDRKINENNLELNDINYAYYKNSRIFFITN